LFLQRNPNIKSTLLPDGYLVLFDKQTDWAHTLTPAAAMIWELSDGQHTVEDMVSVVQSLTGAPQAPEEIAGLARELIASGLIQTLPQATSGDPADL
jgi:hypothetical protein